MIRCRTGARKHTSQFSNNFVGGTRFFMRNDRRRHIIIHSFRSAFAEIGFGPFLVERAVIRGPNCFGTRRDSAAAKRLTARV